MELRATTFADAELVSSWVSSPEELLTFAGPKLRFPLDPQALLDTSLEGWQVRSLFLEGQLVGTGSFTLRDGAVHLGRLMVDPLRRGEGLGRVLVTELLEHARLHNPELARCLRATLNVASDNVAAQRLYESLGFRVLREDADHGRTWLAMATELRPDLEQLAVIAPQVMEQHPDVQWIVEPGDDDRALRLHLRVPGDPRRVALLEVLPTASVFLGQLAGCGIAPDFADMGDEEVEEVFTEYVDRLCALLLGPTTVLQVWRGDRLHSARMIGEREEAGDCSSGELFGLRRRILTGFGVQLEETELVFSDDVTPTGWRPGDLVEPYPVDVPNNWWKTPEQSD